MHKVYFPHKRGLGLLVKPVVMRRVLVLAAVILLGGCTQLGADYQPPELQVQDTWGLPEGTGLDTSPDDLVSWWNAFEDPTLTNLVEHAYQHNYSLEVAGLRVLQARAQLGIAIGTAYPQSQTASGSVIGVSASEANANTSAGDLSYWQYDIAANVGWEPDFWGRFRSGIESADASFLASVANYDDVLVLLTSQVVRIYAAIRTIEERLRIARENLVLQQRSYEIAEVKFRNGEDSELDMQQALTLLLSTEATVPALQAQLVQTRNALATLLSIPTNEVGALLGEP
ncbi:MAG: TolC family protein, partial [Gammaproteobacteria bacterium]